MELYEGIKLYQEIDKLRAENKQLKETIELNQKTNVEVYGLLQENKRLKDLLDQTFLEGADGPARRRIKRIDWNSDGTVEVEMTGKEEPL